MVDTILTPDAFNETPIIQEEQNSFLIDNYFSELETDDQKKIARDNLGVYGTSDLHTKGYIDEAIGSISRQVQSHLIEEDPHGILTQVYKKLANYANKNTSNTFETLPKSKGTPLDPTDLTTKQYVDQSLTLHTTNDRDPHKTMDLVEDRLKLQQSQLKNQILRAVYTKEDIDDIVKTFVKKDGSVMFEGNQSSKLTPRLPNHLTNKEYVDNIIKQHCIDIDPHGFLTILNQRLANYYKTTETYSKAETYSRAQIDKVINTLVVDTTNQAVKAHIREFDPHNVIDYISKKGYIKNDGSVPFTKIQKGQRGIEYDDLIILEQLNEVKRDLEQKIEDLEKPIWVTSGPVQTTVGYLEDNSHVPAVMNFQEIMDAIFYGNVIDVKVPEIASIGTSIPVTMTIRGNALINKASLYQGDILIGEYKREHFLDWYYTVDSKPILKNTVFTFIVEYINGQTVTASSICNVSYGIFVGAVPKMCMPRDLIYNVMLQIVEQGQGAMLSYGENVKVIKHKFNFESPYDPKKLVLAIPSSYNQLDYMHTASQHFGINAFQVEEVLVRVPNLEEAVSYTYYVYNQPLIAFDSEVTFKLSKHE